MTYRLCFFFGLLIGLISLSALAAQEPKPVQNWWEAETSLDKDGRLILTEKSWWKRATELEVGESCLLRSDRPGGGRMLVRREMTPTKKGKLVEAIVWVLDDDGDFSTTANDGDRDSDCYVVDYGCDGRVDIMLDYIDDNGDDRPDEMEIRYFHKGRLSVAWFGVDLDHDGKMWDLSGYEYSYDFFKADPYGDNLVFANKYDPTENRWWPISECPFAFCNSDNDGQSEAVVRLSAVPLGFDPKKETDPGNSLIKTKLPFQDRMRKIGVVNVRYSIDIDGKSDARRPLHYDLGFNMIGSVPYRFEGMDRTNPLRRTPKTVVTLPHASARQMAETYPADQTGFSWREAADDSVTLGVGPRADEDRRWEGVFWTWDRRFMHNTGNPTQRWNMRREFQATPSTKRELYYSRVDRRIHLKGATEGWIEVGYLGDGPQATGLTTNSKPDQKTWGEIRMFDSDRDGYFDRWEVYRTGDARPVRVTTVRDQGVRDLPSDWAELQKIYTKEILPEAIESNRRLIAAMAKLDPQFVPPAYLTRALEVAEDDSQRHYVLDLIRETRYQALREKLPRRIAELDAAYGEGRYDRVVEMLGEGK